MTGRGALQSVRTMEDQLRQVAEAVRTQPDQVLHRIEQLIEDRSRLEARLDAVLRQGGGASAEETLNVNGVAVSIATTDSESRDEVGRVADTFRESHRGAVLVLFGTTGRGAVHVALTDDLVQAGLKAGELVNRIAAVSGGKGGGRPQFASAGAGDPARLGAARQAVPALVSSWLERPR